MEKGKPGTDRNFSIMDLSRPQNEDDNNNNNKSRNFSIMDLSRPQNEQQQFGKFLHHVPKKKKTTKVPPTDKVINKLLTD
jgi:hypothetical protein